MIFHENRLLADGSHEISYLIFFKKLEKMSQNLSSAAVVIGALRVICLPGGGTPSCLFLTSCSLFIIKIWFVILYVYLEVELHPVSS